jgi:hypothetical protein
MNTLAENMNTLPERVWFLTIMLESTLAGRSVFIYA